MLGDDMACLISKDSFVFQLNLLPLLKLESLTRSRLVVRVLLPPANEVCEGYVFTGVCLSTGGCLPHCMLGYTPGTRGRHPPAQCMLGYGQQAGGTHPTGMHSCLSSALR